MRIENAREKHEMSWSLTPAADGAEDVTEALNVWDNKIKNYVHPTATVRPNHLTVVLSGGQVFRVAVSGRRLKKDGTPGSRHGSVSWRTRQEFIENAPVWLLDHMSGQPRWGR